MDSTIVASNPNDTFDFIYVLIDLIEWLVTSRMGNVASILGFGLSAYIAYTARRINRFVLIHKRLPQLLRKLEKNSSTLSNLLNTFDQSVVDIQNELSRCSANLKSVKRKVHRPESASISKLIKLIGKSSGKNQISADSTREIHKQLLYVVEDLKNYQVDFQLER